MRFDLLMMIANGCPRLNAQAIKKYVPPAAEQKTISADFFPDLWNLDDDGHVVKASRALALAQDVSRKWKGRPWVRLDEDSAWLNAQSLLLASAKTKPGIFVRSSGFEEAWADIEKASA